MADKYCAYQEMHKGIQKVEDMIPNQRRVPCAGLQPLTGVICRCRRILRCVILL